MKQLLFIISAIAILPLFTYSSCHQDHAPAKCDGNVMCTQVFAMVTVEVKDSSGQPVTLDEVYTLRGISTDKIKLQQAMQPGNYVILDDNYVKELQNTSAEFHLVGMKAGQEVINEPYTISADCCHINKKTGKAAIVIQ